MPRCVGEKSAHLTRLGGDDPLLPGYTPYPRQVSRLAELPHISRTITSALSHPLICGVSWGPGMSRLSPQGLRLPLIDISYNACWDYNHDSQQDEFIRAV